MWVIILRNGLLFSSDYFADKVFSENKLLWSEINAVAFLNEVSTVVRGKRKV